MDNTTREYEMINIDKIIINPENPRHNPIIGECGEVFIMQQLITNKREAHAMFKLISDIFDNGWYAQSILTVTYDEKQDMYIAWDGNRRTTALKILKTPKILENFKLVFSYNEINEIYKMHNQISDESFFYVPCYIADSFSDCAGYIRNIHTKDTGALPWNSTAIKRFEDKIGNKNIFVELQEVCPEAFKDIRRDFKVRMFEKLVSSKIGKEYLGIKYEDGVLLPPKNINKLNNKVKKIVDDITDGKINSTTVQNNVNIHKHLYDKEEKKEEVEEVKDNDNQISFDEFILDNGYKKPTKEIEFNKLTFNKINTFNTKSNTVKNLVAEVKKMSINNNYIEFPIAYSYLLQSLFKEASIYFLINRNKWEQYKKRNNYIELSIKKIISNINRDKDKLILDEEIKKMWIACFDNQKIQNYLNLVIYHPDRVISNIDIINEFSELGLYNIIQYFLDEK